MSGDTPKSSKNTTKIFCDMLLRRLWRRKKLVIFLATVAYILHKNTNVPTSPTIEYTEFAIATASDRGYFAGLRNLVGSIRVHCGKECPIYIFDIGMDDIQRDEISTWCNVHLRWAPDLNITSLEPIPNHLQYVDVYAWKPVAIKEALHEVNNILWLDAGSTVVSSLQPLKENLMKMKYLFVQGQDTNVVQWTHPDVWKRFNAESQRYIGKPSFAGNTLGFSRQSALYNQIFLPWYRCALELECIMPPNSTFDNHRFDQSVLSVLLYSSGLDIQPRTDFITADAVPCKNATSKIIWTSRRKAGNCYSNHVKC